MFGGNSDDVADGARDVVFDPASRLSLEAPWPKAEAPSKRLLCNLRYKLSDDGLPSSVDLCVSLRTTANFSVHGRLTPVIAELFVYSVQYLS
jgi:hypothetical protein